MISLFNNDNFFFSFFIAYILTIIHEMLCGTEIHVFVTTTTTIEKKKRKKASTQIKITSRN